VLKKREERKLRK